MKEYENYQIGYQTESIEIPVSTGASTKESTIVLDQTYDEVCGVALVPITNGDQTNYNVGLNINGETILNLTDFSLVTSGNAVAPEDKFLPFMPRKAAGRSATLRLQNTGTTATDSLKVQFVFKLRRKVAETLENC